MIKIEKHDQVVELWLEHKEALNRYVFKLVKDHETAEQITSDVMMKIYSSCCSGRPIKNLRSWLFQIAYNTCMDHFRKSSKIGELKLDVPETGEEEMHREISNFIEPLIRLLPEKYAKPLNLSEIQNIKQREVAAQLNLSLPATKSRILRAKEMLREIIVECMQVETDCGGKILDYKVRSGCKAIEAEVKDHDHDALKDSRS